MEQEVKTIGEIDRLTSELKELCAVQFDLLNELRSDLSNILCDLPEEETTKLLESNNVSKLGRDLGYICDQIVTSNLIIRELIQKNQL